MGPKILLPSGAGAGGVGAGAGAGGEAGHLTHAKAARDTNKITETVNKYFIIQLMCFSRDMNAFYI